MKILLVEDSLICRKYLENILKTSFRDKEVVSLITTDNLGEAKSQYVSSDLIIFDLNLADADPETTIEFISSILDQKPICVYTGEMDERIMKTLKEMGIGVIKKELADKDVVAQEIYKTEVNFEKNKMTGLLDQMKNKLLELKQILKSCHDGNS